MTKQGRGRPLNIIHLRDHLVPSGGTTYFQNVLTRFDPGRVRASLCVLQPPDDFSRWFETAGVPTFCVGGSKRDVRRLVEVGAVIRAQNPDLLVLSGPKSMIIGGMFARIHGVPTSPRFNHMMPDPLLTMWLQRRLSSTTAVAVAVSDAVRNWASTYYGLPKSRIRVIHPGHHVARYVVPRDGARRSTFRAALGIDRLAPVLALTGRLLSVQKGQELLIRAMPDILRECPDTVLVIVGEGPDRGALEAQVREMGLAAAVRLLGHRDDVPEVLAASDAVVVPSLCEEAFPFSALEGLAAGCAVVAFAVGGLPEMVRDGATGLLVARGNASALVDAIVRLLRDETLRDRLGQAGSRFAARFTVEAHVKELTAFYEEIAAARV